MMGRDWAGAAPDGLPAAVAKTEPLDASRWVVAKDWACATATTPTGGVTGERTAKDVMLLCGGECVLMRHPYVFVHGHTAGQVQD